MSLELLPTRMGGAAENMAIDFLMLQRYPRADVSRLRHYGWRLPAFTFGYSQKIQQVRAALPMVEKLELCRRPTGGGMVDHRNDWTYALVIPRGHPVEEIPATESYRAIHECLSSALRQQDIPTLLKQRAGTLTEESESGPKRPPSAAASVCFTSPEFHDIVHRDSGKKIAGAAQKRNKRGLLFQGSLARGALGRELDDERLLADFVSELERRLMVPTVELSSLEINDDELSALTENYSSPEWTEFR
jgi:lipoate-protein ligase A